MSEKSWYEIVPPRDYLFAGMLDEYNIVDPVAFVRKQVHEWRDYLASVSGKLGRVDGDHTPVVTTKDPRTFLYYDSLGEGLHARVPCPYIEASMMYHVRFNAKFNLNEKLFHEDLYEARDTVGMWCLHEFMIRRQAVDHALTHDLTVIETHCDIRLRDGENIVWLCGEYFRFEAMHKESGREADLGDLFREHIMTIAPERLIDRTSEEEMEPPAQGNGESGTGLDEGKRKAKKRRKNNDWTREVQAFERHLEVVDSSKVNIPAWIKKYDRSKSKRYTEDQLRKLHERLKKVLRKWKQTHA